MTDRPAVFAFPVHLPRHAFSPRDAARAGDVWRACQEAAVHGSTLCGWPPGRYRDAGCAFVVRAMTTVHHREARYGEALDARTWISDFRRGLLTSRQIELRGADGPIASATQEWAHVSAAMRPTRAAPELVEAFRVVDGPAVAELPPWEPDEGPRHLFRFACWHTWMDPLAHANHPAYVDWCDEALSRAMSAAGLDPLGLAPVAEWVKWRRGVLAGEEVVVATRRVGRTAARDVVFAHEIATAAGEACASAVTVRRLVDGGSEALGMV